MRLLLAVPLLALPALAFAQGALTPPAGPAPTMKSLDQVEPRIPLADGIPGLNRETNGGFTIQNPGSYYLTGNLSVSSGDAITINSSGVTLDLNGFTIFSRFAGTAGSGITTGSNTAGITIRNGFVRGGVTTATGGFVGNGFLHGIDAANSHSVHVEAVTVRGLVGNGITLASGSGLIRSCTARLCGLVGLRANHVIDSEARQCGSTAIFAGTAPDGSNGNPVADGVAANCTGESLADGRGIFATTATNCYGISASSPGIEATTAIGCSGYSATGWGLRATDATNCHGKSERGIRGLYAANTATGCTGEIVIATGSTTNSAIGAYGLETDSAIGCRGIIGAFTNSCIAIGIRATNASNSHGSAPGMGISCTNAQNCTGEGDVVGILATGTASFCCGTSDATAVLAGIAAACTAKSGTIVVSTANGRQLGTP